MVELSSILTYRLNSGVSWSFLADHQAQQIRFPDGDHLTVDAHAERVADILQSLSTGNATDDYDLLTQEVVQILAQRHVLIRNSEQSADWMEDMFEYILASAARQATATALIAEAKECRFSLIGEGWLPDRIAESCSIADLTLVKGHAADSQYLIAAADHITYDEFSRLNAKACSHQTPIIFFWREVTRIVCGPLVLPGESACFECYRTRVRANVQFSAEFDAYAALKPDKRSALDSRLAAGAAHSFIARQLLAIAAKTYEMVEPNTIYSYDTLSLTFSRQSLRRLPRCAACGTRRADPMRAVRSIA